MSIEVRHLAVLLVALLAAGCREATAPRTDVDPIDDAPGAVAWSALSSGAYSSCALTAAGRAYCWGPDPVAPCTASGCPVNAIPTAVPGAPDFVSVTVGGFQSCGLARDAQLWCWGKAFNTTLGDGVTTTSATPVRVPLPERVAQVSAGYGGTCALDVAGVAYCWGDRGAPLGAGAEVDRTDVPLTVATPLRFTAISVGTTHACAIDTNRDAYCWGSGYGSLGIGAADTSCAFAPSCAVATAPMLVVGGLKWADISAGTAFTCGVTTGGAGYCWGDVREANPFTPPTGVLGSGELAGSKSPVPVAGGHTFRTISAGSSHACGIATDGAAFCWGLDEGGQLGIGPATPVFPVTTQRYATPQPVVGGLLFRAISMGMVSCGISAGANLYCWGITAGGQLGNGVIVGGYRAIPTRTSSP